MVRRATGIAFLSATMTTLQLGSIPAMRAGSWPSTPSSSWVDPAGGPLSGWIAERFDTGGRC